MMPFCWEAICSRRNFLCLDVIIIMGTFFGGTFVESGVQVGLFDVEKKFEKTHEQNLL